ncbi:Vancomycin/teicoplanin A-type resistance protein VanA [compost metagenome]
MATETTPAAIKKETLARVTEIVKNVYLKLNCRGVVRIDFILNEDEGDFYFIEINTIPGQTGTSFIPQQVAAAGMKLNDFYTKLIRETIG